MERKKKNLPRKTWRKRTKTLNKQQVRKEKQEGKVKPLRKT